MSIERDIEQASKNDPHVPMLVGSQLGGPELQDSVTDNVVSRFQTLISKIAKTKHLDSTSAELNIVVFLPGSIIQYDDVQEVDIARFSRQKNALLARVKIPIELTDPHDVAQYLIESTYKAIDLAVDVCEKKGVEFAAEDCHRILEEARKELYEHPLLKTE